MSSVTGARFVRHQIGARAWLRGVVALDALLLLAPTLVVIPMSFSNSQTFAFPPRQWSLRWYRSFFSNPQWLDALRNSLEVAVLTALVATALGTAAAYALNRMGRGRGAARAAMLAPMIIPNIVVAVAIYSIFLRWHLTGTVPGFVMAHTVLALPFVITAVSASLAGYDRTVEVASASLGANWWTTMRRVTLPLIAPGVLSGLAFAFATSFDEVVIALFLQSPTLHTLPVQMFDAITLQIDPTIAAASSLVVVVTTALILSPFLFHRKWQLSRRKRKTS